MRTAFIHSRLLSIVGAAALLASVLLMGPGGASVAEAGSPVAQPMVMTLLCPDSIQTPGALTAAGGAAAACDNTVLPEDEPDIPDGYVAANLVVAEFDYTLTPPSGSARTLSQAELSGGGFCDPGTMTCAYAYSYQWFDVPTGTTTIKLQPPAGYRPGAVRVTNGEIPEVVIGATVDLAAGTVSFAAPASNVFVQVAYFRGFADTVGSPFNADISWIAAQGITGGCGGFRYCPKNPVTREQMASFLVRGLDLAPSGVDAFTDDESSIHEADINALAAAGVTGGCATDRFCPKATVTREQMASFLVRGLDLAPSGLDAFTDDESSIHEADINALATAGVTGGCATDRFCPKATVTREQMAAFLRRGLEL